MKNTLAGLVLVSMAGTALAQIPEPTPPTPTPAPEVTPTPPPEPTPPAPTVEVKSPEPPPPADVEPPKKLTVGKGGLFQPGMLAQGWFILERGNSVTTSTFRLRRAEISAKGEIIPKQVGYSIMFDVAKVRELANVKVPVTVDTPTGPVTGEATVRQPTTAISALQDFYITALTDYADISLGQFKIPVSWEGYNSSSKIIMPERAIVSTLFGDRRDLGIRITKTFDKVGYSAGVFNGAGLNNLDNNNQKDVALRLEAYPVKGMTIAGVTYDSIGYRKRGGTKDRWEGDFRYETGPYLVQAEYIRARDVGADGADAVSGQGAYLALGYTLKDPSLHGDLQPVLRVGYLDPDASKNLDGTGSTDELVHYDVGVNYYLRAHEMKLQGSYQRQQFDDKKPVDQVIVAAQVSY